MKNVFKRIISFALVISMLFCSTVPTFAEGTEEYICELRLIYADDYEEAKQILADSDFSEYKILKENLNKNSDEIGVWLAYKTTTDIEDAITDIAIMQMGGGYKIGNYQQMIKESYDEYVAMGEIYLQVIEYFIDAYDAGDFLAKSAYRQLNFYNVETQKDIGLDIPTFEGKLLGDIFYDGIDEHELATMFFEGNSYALKNIRSLLAMGVSYNEDGKTYFEKVSDAVAEMKENPKVFDDKDYEELAKAVALSVTSIRDVLNELALYEDELDYSDDNFTNDEFHYIEIKAVADKMREINYLGGKTLYQFFMEYKYSEEDASELYPLIAALNEGQMALVKVGHYYDVVRYSVALIDENAVEQELVKMEETYAKDPFNIYTGVDRSIYNGTFALTTAADRADAYSELDMLDEFLGTSERANAVTVSIVTGTFGLATIGMACVSRYMETVDQAILVNAYKKALESAAKEVADDLAYYPGHGYITNTWEETINGTFKLYYGTKHSALSFTKKIELLQKTEIANEQHVELINIAKKQVDVAQSDVTPVSSTAPVSLGTGFLFVVGGALMIYSAYNILSTVYYYYNPEYDDVPIAMVDMIETTDGDRYIKYDVVFEAKTRNDGKYSAGDLNAFEGKRWNALYYTKSYEAGKPLLANEIVISNTNNQPKDGYTSVHLFGETICFDLNKYNFDGDTSIYLSIKQSKNNKSAVADVPEIVGSMFGTGFLLLAGGIGVALGAGGVFVTQRLMKKKNSKVEEENKTEE